MTDLIRSLASLLFAAALIGAEPAPAVDGAAAALEDLRAANVARAGLAREWQEWQAESERTYALLDTVQSQVSRLRADAANAREATATLAQEVATAGASRRRLDALDEVFSAQARAIDAALARAKSASAPGAVSVPSGEGEPRAAFAAAIRALEAAERSASTSAVEIAEGMLDGQRRAVTLLRVAGLGWWSEIDGPRSGVATPAGADAPPTLEVVSDPAFAQAIRHAIATTQGSRPPELFVLPLRASAISLDAPASGPSAPVAPGAKKDALPASDSASDPVVGPALVGPSGDRR